MVGVELHLPDHDVDVVAVLEVVQRPDRTIDGFIE